MTAIALALWQGKEGWHILFNQKDEVTVEAVDDDHIVISTDIGNNTIKMIFIDDGSAVEILSYDVFHKLRLNDKDLRPTKLTFRFGNNFIHVCEGITLLVT